MNRPLNEQLLFTALECSHSTVVITHADSSILYVNEGMIVASGYSRSELLGKTPNLFRSGLTPHATYAEMWQTLTAGKSWAGELLNKRKNGTHYWADLLIIPVQDESGKTTHYIALGRDITERKLIEKMHDEQALRLAQANDKLSAMDEEKNRFLGMAAHDLRSPLSKIKMSVDILLGDEKSLSEQSRKFLKVIDRTAEGMLELLGDLLNVTKIETGKVDIRRSQTSLVSLLGEIEVSESILFERKNITLCIERNEDLASATIDGPRIRQVLLNLLSNAAKFSSPGTMVVLRVLSRDGKLVFEIEDEGPGIAEADQSLLFQPFQKTRNSPTGNESSTGLGLSICKRLIELHGGSIGMRSTPKGGSCFFFELPGVLT